MRKIINSTYISLDGVVEGPHKWPSIERPSDGRGDEIQTDLLMACDAVLMGRRTYESFAPVWQARSGDPFSDRINAMSKYVVSKTLADPDWANTTVIADDVAKRIRELKEEPGQDIVQYGFGAVSTLLMEHVFWTSCGSGSTRSSSAMATPTICCSRRGRRRSSSSPTRRSSRAAWRFLATGLPNVRHAMGLIASAGFAHSRWFEQGSRLS
jgi:dihydrofolate reductase